MGGFGDTNLTSHAALARFLFEEGLLVSPVGNKYSSLTISTLETYISTIANEDKKKGSRKIKS